MFAWHKPHVFHHGSYIVLSPEKWLKISGFVTRKMAKNVWFCRPKFDFASAQVGQMHQFIQVVNQRSNNII